VAFRLALGFDPAIAHMFGVDPNASDTVLALLPPTEATVEQWLDAIAKHPHSWMWHFTTWLDTLRSFSALAWAARRAPAPKLET
jgi:poly(3-hydroxyalkanoate) synthetase